MAQSLASWGPKVATAVVLLGLFANSNLQAQNSQTIDINGNNNTVVQVIIELSQGDPDWLHNNENRVTKLAERLGVSNALLANFLGRIEQGEVPRDRWPELLAKVAEDYSAFKDKAELLAANDPIARDSVEGALKAAERAEFAEADRLLVEAERQEAAAEEELDAAIRKRRLNRVQLAATRAQNFLVELKYGEAGKLFEESAHLAESFDEKMRADLLNEAAQSYYLAGKERGDSTALVQAITTYRDRLLPLRTRQENPKGWAKVQNNLGNVLWVLGTRESGRTHLEEAAGSFMAALEIITRDRSPLEWATIQSNLGATYWSLAEREAGTSQLEKSVSFYRASLEVRTRNGTPKEWADSQMNLAITYQTLGARTGSSAQLEQAISSYREALSEYDRARMPLLWAQAQSNLGNALSMLGEQQQGNEGLLQAITAYSAALEERTRDRVPMQWAATKKNLGNALQTLGLREDSAARLGESVAAYQEALLVYSQQSAPLQWAWTQDSLGNALLEIGQRERGTDQLRRAIAAYQETLKIYTLQQNPDVWATTQTSLGNAYAVMGERTNGIEELESAVAAYRAASTVRTRGRNLSEWSTTQFNLCLALRKLGDVKGNKQLLREALLIADGLRQYYQAEGKAGDEADAIALSKEIETVLNKL